MIITEHSYIDIRGKARKNQLSISSDEDIEGFASKALADAGVDMLNITGGMCRYTRQGHNEPGYFQDMSSAIKFRGSKIPTEGVQMHPLLFSSKPCPVRLPRNTCLTIAMGFIVNRV